MNSLLKKITAIAVTVLLLVTVMLPAAAAEYFDAPVIYLGDITENRLYMNPDTIDMESVFPPEEDTLKMGFVKTVAGLVYAGTDTTGLGSKAQTGVDLAEEGISSLIKNLALDENGEARKNTGVNHYKKAVSAYAAEESVMTSFMSTLLADKNSIGAKHTYVFTYDWRLDPIANAEELYAYINYVRSLENIGKVRLLCGGYGGIIANTLFYTYGKEAYKRVQTCVFLDSPLLGNSIVGDLMCGNLTKITLDIEDISGILDLYEEITGETRGDAFIRYINDDPYSLILSLFEDVFSDGKYTSAVATLVPWIVNVALKKADVMSEIGQSYNKTVLMNGEKILSESGLAKLLYTSPGLWALVPEESYDSAWLYMFDEIGDEPTYKLSEQIKAYRAVQKATATTLQNAVAGGVYVSVVSGYNMQTLPVTGTIDEHSDGITLTRLSSVGATCVRMAEATIDVEQAVPSRTNYLAPDKTVDASTCALPMNTWFIRNHTNMRYDNPSSAAFINWLLMAKSQPTILQDLAYPQYLGYSKTYTRIYALSDQEQPRYYGDVNLDNHVDAGDARTILRVAVDLDTLDTYLSQLVADIDGDGEITADDARAALRLSVGLDAFE